MTLEENKARYTAACHAMQTGVAFEMNARESSHETDPKHLRVGVNSAMVDSGAIVKLLIAKGVFTEKEFWAQLADQMEAEVEDYRARIARRTGQTVVLR